MNRIVFVIGIAGALAVAAFAVYVAGHAYIPEDAVIERDVQATNWSVIALTFPLFSWIGDAKGFVAEVGVFLLILIFNRRAWPLAAGAAATGLWYVLLSNIIHRPRPTTAQVLRVTEHPGAWSFPSGHSIFVTTVVLVIVLCLANHFLHGWPRLVAWVLAAAVILIGGISRVYTGTHWPSDVISGILIAVTWVSLLLAVRPVYERVAK